MICTWLGACADAPGDRLGCALEAPGDRVGVPEGEADDELPLGLGAAWPCELEGLALGEFCVTPCCVDVGLATPCCVGGGVAAPCCVGWGVTTPCCVGGGVADGTPELTPLLGKTVGVGLAEAPCGWPAGAAAATLSAAWRLSQQLAPKRLWSDKACVLTPTGKRELSACTIIGAERH